MRGHAAYLLGYASIHAYCKRPLNWATTGVAFVTSYTALPWTVFSVHITPHFSTS